MSPTPLASRSPAPACEKLAPIVKCKAAGHLVRRFVARVVKSGPPVYFLTFGALPVPDSGIFCGSPVSSSLTINSPLCAMVSVGLKVTETLQLFPGANDVLHWLVTANGAAADSVVTITVILDFLEAPFLIVTVLGLLTELTMVDLPNFTDLGENASSGSTGVGVADGVGVAEGVGVAVAVADTVIVAVAVGEGVPVALAVGVGVAVGVAIIPS